MNVYFAGKISKNCRRHILCSGLSDSDNNGHILDTVFNGYYYCGPYFVSCDHGCYHGKNKHGAMGGCGDDFGIIDSDRRRVFGNCMMGIGSCDIFYAWIDSKDCYGTINEIGIAFAMGKDIRIAIKEGLEREDMWFSIMCAKDNIVFADNPLEGFRLSIQDRNLKTMPYKDYLQTDHWLTLRDTAKERDGNKCVMCNSSKKLQVHHRSYNNRGNFEQELKDIHTVCSKCHSKFHNK